MRESTGVCLTHKETSGAFGMYLIHMEVTIGIRSMSVSRGEHSGHKQDAEKMGITS